MHVSIECNIDKLLIYKRGSKVKKVLLLLVVLVLVMGMNFSAAFEVGTDEIGPCTYYGVHRMEIQNTVPVVYYENSTPGFVGMSLYKCDCGEVFLTTSSPHLAGHAIGDHLFDSDVTLTDEIASPPSYATSRSTPREGSNLYYLEGFRFYD